MNTDSFFSYTWGGSDLYVLTEPGHRAVSRRRLFLPLISGATPLEAHMETPSHLAEARRVHELRRHHILDTPPDRRFDLIAESAAGLYRAPIALVTFLDGQRQWFKAAVGLILPETPRGDSFCTHALAALDVMVVPDAAQDPRFRDNPLVTANPTCGSTRGHRSSLAGTRSARSASWTASRAP